MRHRLLVLVFAGLAVGGCGNATEQDPLPLALVNTESSWVPGQPSLWSLDGFAAIAERADALALERLEIRELELARIAAALEAAERRAKAEALRAYEEAKRKAEAAYQEALREAARQRRIQARRLAAAKRRRARELAELRKKLQVKPGEECTIPEIAAQFDCRTGQTPLPEPLPEE